MVEVDEANVIVDSGEGNHIAVGNTFTIVPTPQDLILRGLPGKGFLVHDLVFLS